MTTKQASPKIEILPEHIIDQIKAGEVLERPAALVKELLENSLDAGSTEIHIHLIENGMDLLSIEDNGHGMSFENLPYAFLRHATSKLKSFDDIYRLRSFGFRGEALASVAASARLTCTSQPKDLTVPGGKIVINGGATELLIEQQADTQGTSLFIKDLFFNTPARLKFVKSKVSEKSALKKMLYSFVLSHPTVTFTIKWDEKEKEIFKATDDSKERVAQVFFGKKIEKEKVVFQEQSYEGYNVKVYFTPDTYTTPQYRHHYLFVNKRFFQDKSLHQTVLRNVESFWRHGESGHYVIDITTPPEDIDVNVHPNKTMIKFLRSDVVYSLLSTSLKTAVKTLAESVPRPTQELNFFKEPSATSFFTKDEHQSFDLMNFGGNSHEKESYSQSFQNLFANVENQDIQHIRLSPFYLMIKKEYYEIIDLKKCLTQHFIYELETFIEKEEIPGPLLVSEPFKIGKGKIDTHFEGLKSLGFEFDRLNAEFIVLRTIPRFLPQSLLSSFARMLVDYFNQPKIAQYEKQSLKKYFIDHLSEDMLIQMPESYLHEIIEKDTDSDAILELTNERLKTLFKT
jgi:DNA mismatch repair protein MutL